MTRPLGSASRELEAGSAAVEQQFATLRPDGDGDALLAIARGLVARNRQLEHALESRVVIEQAKGVLAERYALPVDDAFGLLRRAARSQRVRIHDLAREVVESRTTPISIAALVADGDTLGPAA